MSSLYFVAGGDGDPHSVPEQTHFVEFLIPHASRIPTSPQRATFMENEYGWFMCVYGMSFVSSEILKPEPRKHKKIKAPNSEVGTNYRPK